VTSEDIQTQLNDSACMPCMLSEKQLLQVQAVLLWKQLNGDVPMTNDDIQATLSDAACLGCRSAYQLQQIIAELLWEILQKP